jgi:hypothetical protein
MPTAGAPNAGVPPAPSASAPAGPIAAVPLDGPPPIDVAVPSPGGMPVASGGDPTGMGAAGGGVAVGGRPSAAAADEAPGGDAVRPPPTGVGAVDPRGGPAPVGATPAWIDSPVRGEDDAVTALLKLVVRGLEIAGSLTATRASEAGEAASALAAIGTERDLKPPPPRRGQAPRGQAALPVDGVAGDGVEGLAKRALERTEGALSRILLEQFAALDRRDDPTRPMESAAQRQWTAEMPIATAAGTGVVQMSVERDGGRKRGDGSAPAPAWRIRFSLDVEPLGPIHAQIGFSGDRLAIGLWAERPDAAARLGADVGRLEGALEAAAIPVESIHLATGRPTAGGVVASAGRLVDVKL